MLDGESEITMGERSVGMSAREAIKVPVMYAAIGRVSRRPTMTFQTVLMMQSVGSDRGTGIRRR